MSGKLPIVIINRDRLTCTKQLIERLLEKHCDNIYILDSNSTYEPLLDYYLQISKTFFIQIVMLYQ